MSAAGYPPELSWRLESWFPHLSKDILVDLKEYYDLLVKFNQTINLVSPKSLIAADDLHFADSVLSYKIIQQQLPEGAEVFDLGSGNGFPGLVYGVLDRKRSFVLVDSDLRKTEFLKLVAAQLNLKNVTVLNKRVEDLSNGSVKFAVSRAFANLTRSGLLCRKAITHGGVYFHLKGDSWAQEIAEMPTAVCSLWVPKYLGGYSLPGSGAQMHIVSLQRSSRD